MRFFLVLIVFLSSATSYSQNLIVNPGAELNPIGNGWTQVSGFWTNGAEVTAHGGSYHFYAGDNSVHGDELYQDVDVSALAVSIDASASTFSFSTWMRVYNFSGGFNDQSRLYVEYRNGVGTVLSTYDTGARNTLSWTTYSDVRIAPVGTRTIRIRMVAYRFIGTAADGYFDDLSLTHSSTLPVSLISFEGISFDKKIQLKWQTSHEKFNDYFILEKSEDALVWNEIARVDGFENSDNTQEYSIIDNYPLEGVNYYRLKQTDLNGTNTTYQIISVAYFESKIEELKLFPNPTNGIINIQYPLTYSAKATLTIYSSTGQKILSTEISDIDYQLNLSEIPQGVYRIEVVTTTKVLKKTLIKV